MFYWSGVEDAGLLVPSAGSRPQAGPRLTAVLLPHLELWQPVQLLFPAPENGGALHKTAVIVRSEAAIQRRVPNKCKKTEREGNLC